MSGFASTAALAVNVTFDAFGVDATYTPVGGDPLSGVKVIVKKEQAGEGFGDFTAKPGTVAWTFEVRASSLADGTVRKDDTLVIDAGTFTVQPVPFLDVHGVVWTFEARKTS